MRFKDQVVVVTGASSGIGEALARAFSDEGARLLLLARREERLNALAAQLPGASLVVRADVTEDGQVEMALERARAEWGRIDVVVANAGFGVAGTVEKLGLEDFRRQFETNVFGVLRTVKAAIPDVAQARGAFVLMGSVNGYVALPGGAPYAMSKYAVRALADSLHLELRPRGVCVTHVAPGFVDTEIRKVNNRGELKADRADPVPAWLQISAPAAARQVVSAVARRRREVVLTALGKSAVFLERHAPGVVRTVLERAPARGAKA